MTSYFIMCMVQQIMTAHMTFNTDVKATTEMRYTPWRNRFCLFTIAYCSVVSYINLQQDNPAFQRASVFGILIAAVIAKSHYVYNIGWEMSDTLGIRVWRVKERTEPFKAGNIDINSSFDMKPKKKD
jgi:hypothetical protein